MLARTSLPGNTSVYLWDIELPNSGMTLRIPLLKFRFDWRDKHPGRGVLPEVLVAPLADDIGPQTDQAVARALQLLTSNPIEQ